MVPADVLLETLVPGYRLLARSLPSYFHVDITSYLLVFAGNLAFWAYAMPLFWDRFQSLLLLFSTSVEIGYHDDFTLSHTLRFVAGTRINFATLWDDTKEDERDLSEADQLRFENDPRPFWIKRTELNNLRIIRYTPAPAQTHYFTYRGCLIALRRQPYKDAGSPWVASMEKLYFYAAPWKKDVLKDLLYSIQKASSEHDKRRVVVKRGLKLKSDFQWTRMASKKPRPLSTSRGLPYRRGYLFYGPPGTGKSSLCFAIASLVQPEIFMVSLSASDLDENGLALLFQSLPNRCIVLFEDVDQAGIRKRDTDIPLSRNRCETDEITDCDGLERHGSERRSSKITLSALLNVIDGVSAQEGRILIMTTNHIEKLDGALLRPGRVDMRVPFHHVDSSAIQQLFLSFFLKPTDTLVMDGTELFNSTDSPSPAARPDWDIEDIMKLALAFGDKVPQDRYTAAEVQNYLLLHKNDPKSAVRDVADGFCKIWCSSSSKVCVCGIRAVRVT
ncbi:P-loop containing nucleoside triphosphate hydrolase protein [Aspergillus welwitschiae]|uniref:P-loop containing nucleoside triphosphate hydrolase protein n=1 Tax=Aspergillus welwitschiae TaxID=1341132 RepID=A0A3F3PIE1_9EURO|nr:P-loop containing nucleoside triphosphate hydrolase protein [Aspergillus welwitschiae]RDH26701.1 P-loop containing nucleoside triphosphate hydrolase protein [Aspergillus welwitschiae]